MAQHRPDPQPRPCPLARQRPVQAGVGPDVPCTQNPRLPQHLFAGGNVVAVVEGPDAGRTVELIQGAFEIGM